MRQYIWEHSNDRFWGCWSKPSKRRWQHETTTPTKCPCTNNIRILEKKHVSPIHRSSPWRTADPSCSVRWHDLILNICFQLKHIIQQTQTYMVYSLNLKLICQLFSHLNCQREIQRVFKYHLSRSNKLKLTIYVCSWIYLCRLYKTV